MDVETLAMLLHEAGREAVEKGATVAAENLGDTARKFLEWGEISETAKEGRRIQARFLIARGIGFAQPAQAVANSVPTPTSPPPKIDVRGKHIN